MAGVFLSVGVVLLVLDRVIYAATATRFQERLYYYIFYYRPRFRRQQFLVLICLAICVSILINYLLFFEVHILTHLVLFLGLIGSIYVMLLLLTLFDFFVLKGIDPLLHFYSLENDFIQIFSLGLFFPFLYLAYGLMISLYLFRYPSQGIYLFNSFAGPVGLLSFSLGLIMLFL